VAASRALGGLGFAFFTGFAAGAASVGAFFASVLGVVRALATVPPGSVGTRSVGTRAPTVRHA
jgi:hypothetical protein